MTWSCCRCGRPRYVEEFGTACPACGGIAMQSQPETHDKTADYADFEAPAVGMDVWTTATEPDSLQSDD